MKRIRLKRHVVRFWYVQYVNIHLIHELGEQEPDGEEIIKEIFLNALFLKTDVNFQVKRVPNDRFMVKLLNSKGRKEESVNRKGKGRK